jgi:hypothetical protein
MINKLTTVHSVISKVVRDFALEDNEVRWQDMIEWIAEGINQIGAYAQYTEKEAIIAIEDYKGVLPCDFYRSIRFLDGCSLGNNFNGPYWDLTNKLLEQCGYQETNTPCTVENGDCYQVVDMYSFQKLQLMQYSKIGYFSNFFGNLKRNGGLMDKGVTFTGVSDSYNINHDTITATFRYGYVALRYLAIPVDEQGYPLVPDDISYLEALTWKCVEKLATRGHQFKNPVFNDFEAAKFYWNKYCMQARGVANAPDPDMMQRLANIWGTLSINYDKYYTDFNSLGNRNMYNLNGHG